MNAKKKNKKANKPPNPNPPQKVENVATKEEKVEETTAKCEMKETISVSKISCDVPEIPVSDIKDTESETPKKPKRNKGKNKKQDKEETIEVQDKPETVQNEYISKVEEPIKKIVTKDNEFKETLDLVDEATVIPSARKKKNKKKLQEQLIEETKTFVDDSSTIVLKEQVIEQIEKTDIEMQELSPTKSEIPKQEGKKKKNKKKNRTDSERSDKSDNVLSCTSAFQNILAEDISKIQNFGDTVEAQEPIIDLKLDSENVNTESNLKSPIETKTKEEIKVDTDNIKELLKNESKSKKKNRKDKKLQHQEVIEIPKHDSPEEKFETTALTQTVFAVEAKTDVKDSVQIPFKTQKEKESSPKIKAKFVKPVEKRQKGEVEAWSSENISGNVESIEKDKKIDESPKELEIKSEETAHVNVILPKNETNQELLATTGSIEITNIPSDHAMGKKRKKSPKPPKNKETNVTPNVVLESEKAKTECTATIKDSFKSPLDMQPESQVVTCELIEIPLELPEEALKLQNVPMIDSPEIPFTLEMNKDSEGFETKTSKKKKKTPKIPQGEAISKVEDTKNEIQISEEFKQITIEANQTTEQQTIFSESYPASITEIQSPEASNCDLIPDVHFVRSASQQHLDSNNNTVIQEIIDVEVVKLNDPQLITIIEGSEATPVCTPEQISSGIRMLEVEAKSPTEEKTDIKSKMMEVNQDMEELRLSIERSLAEFTALEKSEKDLKKTSEHSIKKETSPVFKDNRQEAKKSEKIIQENVTAMLEVKEHTPRLEEEIKESEKIRPTLTDEALQSIETPPVCPARKDNKGKGKSKKKGKQESATTTTSVIESSVTQSKDNAKDESKEKPEDKSKQKSESSQKNSKQQSSATEGDDNGSSIDTDQDKHLNSELIPDTSDNTDFEPIDNFEDALTSSIDDVNRTFEMIAKNADDDNIEFQKKLAANKPEINITEAEETDTNRNEKVNPVSQPKNLLGHIDIPVQSNKTDYKKEKNKTPNACQAKVKIKDSVDIDSNKKQSKESQTDDKRSRKISDKSVKESFSRVKNDNEEYVYKYSFRKVFLQSACHVCKKDLNQVRVPCSYCNLVFYCGTKHKDEDWPQHQALCFAVSTLAHMKDQKYIYADAVNSSGQEYRLLRMQTIVSCEKVLKRRLVPWEQEIMLYPRMCADVTCREWRQGKLKDCDGCGQLSFCAAHPNHLPKVHSRWCKSYSLYQKLVTYQQTKGRLEPRLPTKIMADEIMPAKMNEVLAALYEEKIDMNDIQYASLTQMATAPLTTAYSLQLCRNATSITNGHKKHPFTIHVVGAELQFEADALNKWETFYLHLRPDVDELRVVLISPQLNPGNLPLDILGRTKLCENCQQKKRRVLFKFEDNKNYFEYRSSEDFINPDIICAFNPSIQRSSVCNGKDPWPASINTILKLKTPFVVTSYTLNELRKDIARIKQVSETDFKLITEPSFNSFASVRPDRNFISDDEMPLLFKNYCVSVLLGY